jgi:hypothetical protein
MFERGTCIKQIYEIQSMSHSQLKYCDYYPYDATLWSKPRTNKRIRVDDAAISTPTARRSRDNNNQWCRGVSDAPLTEEEMQTLS